MIMDYLEKYIELIQFAQDRESPSGYTEKHHILPRSWWENDYLVVLTAEEHFLAHYYLAKAFPEDKPMAYALWCMCNGFTATNRRTYKVDAKIYAEAKEAIDVSEDTRRKLSKIIKDRIKKSGHPRTNKTVYDFYHDKHGEFSGTNVELCEKFNINNKDMGKVIRTHEGKITKNIRHSYLGWRMTKEKYKIVCPHCGYSADPRIFSIHKKSCNL